MMKDNVAVCLLALGVFAVTVLSVEVASFPMQDSNGGQLMGQDPSHKGIIIPENRSRALLQQLYYLSLLEKLGAFANNEKALRAKKSCLLNAGLSHSCDYRDALAALDEKFYMGSDMTPGRK